MANESPIAASRFGISMDGVQTGSSADTSDDHFDFSNVGGDGQGAYELEPVLVTSYNISGAGHVEDELDGAITLFDLSLTRELGHLELDSSAPGTEAALII